MGFFSTLNTLNPITLGRKQAAAWNVLMAAYTFERLTSSEQAQVKDKVEEIETNVRRTRVTYDEVMERYSNDEKYLLLSLAMNNLGIWPALGGKYWHKVQNPKMDLLGAESHIETARIVLEKEFGVKFPPI